MMRRRDTGFSILEMLTVIVIISVLIALIVGVVGKARERARRAQVLNFIKSIENAAKVFQLAYNRWPWETDGKDLKQKLNAGDVFAELAPGNSSLRPVSYNPLVNRQRTEYLSIAPNWIRDGRVVDLWGNEFEFFWNPDTRSVVIVSPANNQRNETVNTSSGTIFDRPQQNDDINNL